MAQSAPVPLLRSPVGIPFFRDSGMEPPVEWPTWASTLKLAIMAKGSINVDSLLRQKPEGLPWDDADIKVKNLIYSSLGTEGQRIYQQRFPHSVIEQITAFELAHELSFTRPRNTTYDRFLLFRCKKKNKTKKMNVSFTA